MRNDTRYTLAALALFGALGLTAAQPSSPPTGTPGSAEPQQRKGGRPTDAARLESLVTRYDDARAKADAKALLAIEDDLRVVLSGGRSRAASPAAKSAAPAAPADRRQEISKEIGGLLGKMDDPSVGRKSELLHELLDLSRAEAAKGEPK